MGPYGPIRTHKGPYGPIYGPIRAIWAHMGPNPERAPTRTGPQPGPYVMYVLDFLCFLEFC